MEKVDTLIVGGGMAYTFFAALGHTVGTSLLEADKIDLAKEMMEKAKAKGKVVTPNGMVLSCEFSGDPNKATGVGYVSHWSTCPCADQFRRKKSC